MALCVFREHQTHTVAATENQISSLFSKGTTASQQANDDIASHDTYLSNIMNRYVDSILKAKSLRTTHPEASCSFTSLPGTACSMYNRALVMQENQDDFTLLVRFHNRTTSIILYNLALVHHNIGVHLGISALLSHALQLYGRALDSLERGDREDGDSHKLLLAILNNMGNIHAHFFHFENTRQCLNKLQLVLASSNSVMNSDEDYIFFFLNALFQGKELCFAPAA
jgi:hypothetical protein